MKRIYIHTINGQPAYFSKHDGQIVYADAYSKGEACNSLSQLKRQREKSIANRIAWGMKDFNYGYQIFYVKD